MNRNIVVSSVIAVFAMLFLFASPASAQDDDPAEVEAGQAIFEANCARCHGSDGGGTNIGRNLVDVAQEADRSRHIMSVTDGRGGMPAFGGDLAEDEISAAVSYVRLTFVSAQAEESAPEPEPAEEPEAEDAELARTGIETPLLVLVAIGMFSVGAVLRRAGRRI